MESRTTVETNSVADMRSTFIKRISQGSRNVVKIFKSGRYRSATITFFQSFSYGINKEECIWRTMIRIREGRLVLVRNYLLTGSEPGVHHFNYPLHSFRFQALNASSISGFPHLPLATSLSSMWSTGISYTTFIGKNSIDCEIRKTSVISQSYSFTVFTLPLFLMFVVNVYD